MRVAQAGQECQSSVSPDGTHYAWTLDYDPQANGGQGRFTFTGVAPFVSYVRTLYRDWKSGEGSLPGEHKFFCLQGASHSFEFGYREELERRMRSVISPVQ